MDITLTKEQVLTLLRLAYLGNWLGNSERVGDSDDPLITEFDELQKKLFALAGVPERAIEEDTLVGRLVEEYRDDVFWDELSERLAHRDFERLWDLCPDRDTLSPQMQREFEKIRERYDRELEESGIDRLEVMRTIDDVLGEEFPDKEE
ncbi:MAG: hypothetical protein ACREGH_02905 [Minisyncoccia bacterium]